MSLIQKISTNFRIIIQKNSVIFWISEYFHYLCRRLAALGNLKASFHCTHWYRFFPLKKAFSKTYPSFLTVKEGSTSHLGLLSSGEKKETALLGARNRYVLRLADHQRSSPNCAGWDRLNAMFSIPNLKPYLHESAKRKD